MKGHTIKSKLIKAAILSVIFLLGSATGIAATWQYTLHYGMPGSGGIEANSLITDKIAIVNLDEGVTVQDEKVNYAEKLIIDLDDNFLFTGLEDARQGYATGIYAGYMIVPATFSESVVSLNDTPIRAEISYAINDNLRNDVKEEVIYDVLALMNNINDSVSYMYMHSVLDDFHTAQDEANTVMNNDLKEKEAIDAVQANDLVGLVPVTEFTVVENTIEPVDISEYMTQNMEFTSEIGFKYTEYLLTSETEHMKINEEALLLMDEMSNMSDIMSSSNFGQSEDGSSFYQEGEKELDILLEKYRKDLDDPYIKAQVLEDEVGTLDKMDIGVITACINDNILTPIQENVNGFTEAVMAQYEIEQEQLLAYNEAIMEYDPTSYIDHEEIQTLTSDMLDNGANLSAAILETDIQQMEYVADVYAATREDLFTLQDNIIQAKEDSDKAVEEGLQDLKDTKNENSAVNQQILHDFSIKLPYTRLGSLEYVQAYEFMVNPISAINSNAEGNKHSARTDSVRAESDSVNVQAKRQADYQNISILICVVICVIIVSTTIKYHFHKKEESYETE